MRSWPRRSHYETTMILYYSRFQGWIVSRYEIILGVVYSEKDPDANARRTKYTYGESSEDTKVDHYHCGMRSHDGYGFPICREPP